MKILKKSMFMVVEGVRGCCDFSSAFLYAFITKGVLHQQCAHFCYPRDSRFA